MKKIIALIFLYVTTGLHAFSEQLPLHELKLPPGFSIAIYADNIPGARALTLGDQGTVFVGTKYDKVYALVAKNNNFDHADKKFIIATGLHVPNGVAFYNGNLYVAEINRIIRFDNIESKLINPPKPIVVYDKLPDKKWHGWRYIKFGPDGWLYIAIGSPCNVCLTEGTVFGTIARMKPDGSEFQIYAKGIRNSVGFAWDPVIHELWFTDNGRDWMGDDLPPDKLNYAPHSGMNFGFPFFYGQNLPDPIFGKGKSPQGFISPALDLPAHVASLGVTFYTGDQFPSEYRKQIFIAEHGSWNRSKKIGYRISMVTLKDRKPIKYQIFISGWMQNEKFWGRPVDILTLPDGSILVSDDYAGVIYRISYSAPH